MFWGATFSFVSAEELGLVEDTAPAAYVSFVMEKASIENSGTDRQEFTVTLSNDNLTEFRLLEDQRWRVENGTGSDFYFRWTLNGGFSEYVASYNADVNLLTEECESFTDEEGQLVLKFVFVAFPTYEPSTNNQVSAIAYNESGYLWGWTHLTPSGLGYSVEQRPPAPAPAEYVSFVMEKASIENSGTDRQKVTVTLSNDNLTEFRLLEDQRWRVENETGSDFYFRWTPNGGFSELNANYNEDVQLLVDECESFTDEDGQLVLTFIFVALPTYEPSTNNQVSAIAYNESGYLWGWTHLTPSGLGYSVEQRPPGPLPSGYVSFDMSQASINNGGTDRQELTVVLDNEHITELHVAEDQTGAVENGTGSDFHFRWTQANGFSLVGESSNSNVGLLEEECERYTDENGHLVLRFVFVALPSYTASTNNQISAIAYDNEGVLGDWTRLTPSGFGFSVQRAARGEFISLEVEKDTVFNHPDRDAEGSTQRLQVTTSNANLTSVTVTVDRGIGGNVRFLWSPNPEQSHLWEGYDGFFEDRDSMDVVTLSREGSKTSINADGHFVIEFEFRVELEYWPSTDNQVVLSGGNQSGSWFVTPPDAVFDVVAPSPPELVSSKVSRTTIQNNGMDRQEITVTLSNDNLTTFLLLEDQRWRVENGTDSDFYFAWGPNAGFNTSDARYNENVQLLTEECESYVNEDGHLVLKFVFVALPTYEPSTNNQVSFLIYGHHYNRSWTPITDSGEGFSVTETIADSSPAEYVSFDMSKTSITNGETDRQTLKVVLSNDNLTQLRLVEDQRWRAENGTGQDFIFQWVKGEGFSEYIESSNTNVRLLIDECESYTDQHGDFVLQFVFVARIGYAPSTNNQVSAMAFNEEGTLWGWTHLTPSGLGYSVEQAPTAEFVSFEVEKDVVFNRPDPNIEAYTQRLRIALTNANLTELYLIEDQRWRVENGTESDFYLRWGQLASGSYGFSEYIDSYNEHIFLSQLHSRTYIGENGTFVIEFVFRILRGYAPSTNNQVSAMAWLGDEQLWGWTHLTPSGGGFTVAKPPPAELVSSVISMDSIENNGVDRQEITVTLSNDNLTELRLLEDQEWRVENGTESDFYFRWTPNGGFSELNAGYNENVQLLTEECESFTNEDGQLVLKFVFVALSTYAPSTNNQVSAIAYDEYGDIWNWTPLTASGEGFAVE